MKFGNREVLICGRDAQHKHLLLIGGTQGFEMTEDLLNQLKGTYIIDTHLKYKWVNESELKPILTDYYPLMLPIMRREIAKETGGIC